VQWGGKRYSAGVLVGLPHLGLLLSERLGAFTPKRALLFGRHILKGLPERACASAFHRYAVE
jgi:hypothetical protein